jgi:hypothetical protein
LYLSIPYLATMKKEKPKNEVNKVVKTKSTNKEISFQVSAEKGKELTGVEKQAVKEITEKKKSNPGKGKRLVKKLKKQGKSLKKKLKKTTENKKKTESNLEKLNKKREKLAADYLSTKNQLEEYLVKLNRISDTYSEISKLIRAENDKLKA